MVGDIIHNKQMNYSENHRACGTQSRNHIYLEIFIKVGGTNYVVKCLRKEFLSGFNIEVAKLLELRGNGISHSAHSSRSNFLFKITACIRHDTTIACAPLTS